MEYAKFIKIFGVTAICTFIFYLFVTNHYDILIFQSLKLKIPSINFPAMSNSLSNISIQVNATNESSSSSSRTFEFENLVSNYYPRLSIHIFTQNISLIGNSSKLILLGNGFFGDRNWGLGMSSKSSTQKSKLKIFILIYTYMINHMNSILVNSLFCPFLSNRCDITDNFNRFAEADAIVYHIRDHIDRDLTQQKRHPNQRVVFALWESPAHTPNLKSFKEFFNWTMTFRFDSHIVASYYSGNAYVHKSSPFYQLMIRENITRNLNLTAVTADHRPSDEILQKKKLGTAAALISNCGGSSNRLAFIRSLQRYIDVTIYGRCGQSCPSNKNCREFIAENYYFILSFENSLCKDYTSM